MTSRFIVNRAALAEGLALAAAGHRVWGIDGHLDSVEDAAAAGFSWTIASCVD